MIAAQAELKAAEKHFDLACWLYYYSSRIYRPDGLADRIDCAGRIFKAGIVDPDDCIFFTVFEYGDRQFQTLFQMGDGDAVNEALRQEAVKTRNPNLLRAFEAFGWSLDGPQLDLFAGTSNTDPADSAGEAAMPDAPPPPQASARELGARPAGQRRPVFHDIAHPTATRGLIP